jgi:hypothetical protein
MEEGLEYHPRCDDALLRRLRHAGVVRVRRPVRWRPRIIEAGARIDARDFMNERDAALDRTDQHA